jgi:hypothetical protein
MATVYRKGRTTIKSHDGRLSIDINGGKIATNNGSETNVILGTLPDSTNGYAEAKAGEDLYNAVV